MDCHEPWDSEPSTEGTRDRRVPTRHCCYAATKLDSVSSHGFGTGGGPGDPDATNAGSCIQGFGTGGGPGEPEATSSGSDCSQGFGTGGGPGEPDATNSGSGCNHGLGTGGGPGDPAATRAE